MRVRPDAAWRGQRRMRTRTEDLPKAERECHHDQRRNRAFGENAQRWKESRSKEARPRSRKPKDLRAGLRQWLFRLGKDSRKAHRAHACARLMPRLRR